jgi:adenylate cyclase class 2
VTTKTEKEEKIEIEIKLKIENTHDFREKILRLEEKFRRVEPPSLEHNIVFDTTDQQLKRKGCLLRLRKKNNLNILTFKRPPMPTKDSKDYKIKEEIEAEVADFDNTTTILQALGFEIFFIYEKYREVFRNENSKGNIKIMMDHTPIGDFIEIEGSAEEIDRTASALGFTRKDYITANYYTLFRKIHKTGHMQFK